jgi:hypothetical protein
MIRAIATVMILTLSSVSVSQLDADPEAWDGQEVTVTGEIIGDYSTRGDVVWFQLNDDAYASTPLAESQELQGGNTGIGVRLPRPEWSESWGDPGRYGQRGPIVEVTGTFLHNSANDQGETFIDGSGARLLEAARPISSPPASPLRAVIGAVLALGGLVLYRLGRRPRYRQLT